MLLNNSKERQRCNLQLFLVVFSFFYSTIIIMLSFQFTITPSLMKMTRAPENVCLSGFSLKYHIVHHANDNCSSLFYHSVTLFMMCMSNSHVLVIFFFSKRLNHLHLDPLISWFWFFFLLLRWLLNHHHSDTHQSYFIV